MSLLSKIGSLFTGDTVEKAADNLLDKDKGLLVRVGGFVNDLNLTDEERIKYAKQCADAAAEFTKNSLSESTTRSRTRRRIAINWIQVQLFMLLTCFVSVFFDEHLAKQLWEIATSEVMLWGTLSVLAFFFGGYYLKGGKLPTIGGSGEK